MAVFRFWYARPRYVYYELFVELFFFSAETELCARTNGVPLTSLWRLQSGTDDLYLAPPLEPNKAVPKLQALPPIVQTVFLVFLATNHTATTTTTTTAGRQPT